MSPDGTITLEREAALPPHRVFPTVLFHYPPPGLTLEYLGAVAVAQFSVDGVAGAAASCWFYVR